jgi:polysaccharide biosynthesis protein PslH
MHLIHLEPFYVYPSIPDTGLPTVVSEHNVEYEVYDAFARRFSPGCSGRFCPHEASGIRAWESRILKQATHVISVSPQDAEKLKILSGGKPVTVVPTVSIRHGSGTASGGFRKAV